MTYKFKYRRWFFFKSVEVAGHRFLPEFDRMTLYFKDGGILELSKWSKYDVRLGIDWVLAVKKQMEEQSGQSVPVIPEK